MSKVIRPRQRTIEDHIWEKLCAELYNSGLYPTGYVRVLDDPLEDEGFRVEVDGVSIFISDAEWKMSVCKLVPMLIERLTQASPNLCKKCSENVKLDGDYLCRSCRYG